MYFSLKETRWKTLLAPLLKLAIAPRSSIRVRFFVLHMKASTIFYRDPSFDSGQTSTRSRTKGNLLAHWCSLLLFEWGKKIKRWLSETPNSISTILSNCHSKAEKLEKVLYTHKSRTALSWCMVLQPTVWGASAERTEALKATTKLSRGVWVIRLWVCIFSIRTPHYISNFPYKIFSDYMYIFWGMETEVSDLMVRHRNIS